MEKITNDKKRCKLASKPNYGIPKNSKFDR